MLVRRLPTWILIVVLGLAAGCRTVTERWAPDPDEGRPPADGSYLRVSAEDAGAPAETMGTNWWSAFQDPTLNTLMERLNSANPDIAAAAARVDQSFAVLGITRSSRSPTLRGEASAARQRDSVNNLVFPTSVREYEQYRLGLNATWEIDLWGRVRGMSQRDLFLAEAETAMYSDVLLSLQGSLAGQYFAYRSARADLGLLGESSRRWDENLRLEQSRLEFGDGVAADVARARLEKARAGAAVEAAERSAGKLLHAIAALTGTIPSRLFDQIRPDHSAAGQVPRVPAGVPSELLLRRPDLRAADRQLRAAAMQVGVRRADFLPRFTLMGTGGFASLRTENLLASDSIFFELGPQVDIPIFQGGFRKSVVAQARAQWRESAASFQSTFLRAVREVDDALLDVKSLSRELELQQEAEQAAARVASEARDRHEIGLASYFEFVNAEQVRLQASLRENALRHERQAATVRLIQALGGPWNPDGAVGQEVAAEPDSALTGP